MDTTNISCERFEEEIKKILELEAKMQSKDEKESLLHRFRRFIYDSYSYNDIGANRKRTYDVVWLSLRRFLTIKHLKRISSFANGRGGKLIFGIADDGVIVGVDNTQKTAEKFSEILKDKVDPVPEVNLSFESVEGKTLMIAEVLPGNMTPYYFVSDGRREAYRRIGNESVLVSTNALRELVLRGTNKSYDSLLSDWDFSKMTFTKLKSTFYSRAKGDFTDVDFESWGLVDSQGRLTNAGALVADDCPVRHSRLFCTRWNGLTMASGLVDAIDDMEVSGNVILLLQEDLSFCRRNTKKMWYKTSDSRIEFPDYPERSILEGLTNSLIHRSYVEIGSEVHIDIYDDRIEISSPGGMYENRPVQDCDVLHVKSRRRNPILADIFSRLRYMERRGSGFKKICEAYEIQENFRAELRPNFYSDDFDFTLTLYNLNYGMSDAQQPSENAIDGPNLAKLAPNLPQTCPKLAPNLPQNLQSDRGILDFINVISDFPGATIPELSYHSGLSERTVKNYIKQLREAGTLVRIGTNRKGYWSIIMQGE